MTVQNIRKRLKKLGSRKRAAVLRGFFKTGPGEYGAGDMFYGIPVPSLRKFAAANRSEISLGVVSRLMQSPVHEERLIALLVMIHKFDRGNEHEKRRIYKLYFRNSQFVNNWDLVDISAPNIVGAFLADRSRAPLYSLVESMNLWDRRIAVLSTFHFIRNNDYRDILRIAAMLLDDEEDLIHKAVGWMLREVGKRDRAALGKFLDRHSARMPRTMLRYSIERLSAGKKARYMRTGKSVGGRPAGNKARNRAAVHKGGRR